MPIRRAQNMPPKGDLLVSASGLALKTPLGRVFEGVSLELRAGEVCALYGTEGSGKTALLLTLGGRMKFQDGQATVGGYDLRKQCKKVRDISAVSVVERINDVPENLSVHDILAAELQLCGKRGNKTAVARVLDQWKFTELENMPYRSLESYDRVVFGIMLACVADPRLLLVDDIQTGLTQFQSLKLVQFFCDMARDLGIAVIFTTNEYDIARRADGILVMSEKAEAQRQAVLRKQGDRALVPLMGQANGIVDGAIAPDESAEEEA